MASNGWEYVGKKNSDKKSGKPQKKRAPEVTDSPKIDGHIKLSETTFQAFNDLENRKQKQKPINNNKPFMDQNNENEVLDKKVSKSKPKKKTTSPNESPKTQTSIKPLTFEQIAKQLKVSEFEKVSEETKVKFPDMPLIWLKDIAYFLNGKFPSVEPEDVTFGDKPIDYPSSALPTNVLDFIKRNIKQCPQPILQLIQEQLLQNLVKQSAPTMGFRIMLQCISTQFPDFTLKNIQKFIQQRNSYSNRQQICLTILWVASQSFKTDLKSGINIWLELMFPLIGQKAYTKFVIDSLRTLLELHSNIKQRSDVLEVKQFFVLFDFIHSPANGLQMSSQKLLEILYPKIKLISIRNNPNQNSRLYFPHLFKRLISELFVNQKEELLSELTKCLSSDSQCFSVWRSLYSQNLIESSQLLEYLNAKYPSLPSTLSKKLLRETVLSFRNTNDDARNQDRVLKPGHEDCEVQCETLLQTMSSWKFPIKSFIFGLTVILAALLAYDAKSHQSFQKSYTGTLLKRTGTLPVVEQAYNKIETYSLMSYSWLSVNLPVYWDSVSAIVSPYLNIFWQKFTEIMLYLWNSTEVFRVWINKNIPPVLEKITDDYVPKVTAILLQITTHLRTYLNILWTFIVNNSLLVVNWLQTNVLTGSLAPENIQKVMIQTIDVLQTYVSDAYQWTTTQFKGLINK